MQTKNTVIFNAYDAKDYHKKRGTYIAMEELPGPLCHTLNEVIISIRNIDEVKKDYHHVYQRFAEKFCYHDDGQATARFVDTVFLGKPSRHLFKIGSDKNIILILCGGLVNNGITVSVVILWRIIV